jgi:hypothetical protein
LRRGVVRRHDSGVLRRTGTASTGGSQVQKDGKTDYRYASLRRILDVIEVLDLSVDTSVGLATGAGDGGNVNS